MMKTALEKARAEIDNIDSKLIELLKARMMCADKVADWKYDHQMPVSIPDRETEIMEKVTFAAGEDFSDAVTAVFKAMLAASKLRQSIRIAAKKGK